MSHPYAFIIFTAEAIWIGLALRRGHRNLFQVDTLYWLLVGIPLAALLHGLALGALGTSVTVIALKEAINGIANTLIAVCILSPVKRWRRRRNHSPRMRNGCFCRPRS